jgi:hypothetical protein
VRFRNEFIVDLRFHAHSWTLVVLLIVIDQLLDSDGANLCIWYSK